MQVKARKPEIFLVQASFVRDLVCELSANGANLALINLDTKTGVRLNHELTLAVSNLTACEVRNVICRVATYVH